MTSHTHIRIRAHASDDLESGLPARTRTRAQVLAWLRQRANRVVATAAAAAATAERRRKLCACGCYHVGLLFVCVYAHVLLG